MKPSKKDIKAAVDKLKDNKPSASNLDQPTPKLEAAKPNKNRIRKQGI